MLKNLTIGKKIGLGFGVVMVMLAVVAVFSYVSAARMADTIPGKILDGNLAQKEVDHLNWANHVSALLTDDDITTLNVQTDPHKCGFGQWLYGEGRREAEKAVPSIAPLLTEIEQYHGDLHTSAIEIGEHFRQADAMLPGLLAAREVDHLVWTEKINALFMKNLPRLELQTDPTKCAFGRWLGSEETHEATAADPEYARLVDACKEPHSKLHTSAVAIQGVWQQRHEGLIDILNGRLADHRKWVLRVAEALINEKKEVGVQTDPAKCAFGHFLASDEAQAYMADFPALKTALDACRQPHEDLHGSAIAIESALKAGNMVEAKKVFADQAMPALALIAEHFGGAIEAENEIIAAQAHAHELFNSETVLALSHTRDALHKCSDHATHALEGLNRANTIYAGKTRPSLEKVQSLLGEVRHEIKATVMTDDAMLAAAQSTKRNVSVVGGIAMILGALLAFLISRGIIKTLTRIITGMNEGADQVNDAAGQVAGASQQLAEGASEQASSLEETSSALEEMAAMTRTNAENARQANDLSGQARDAAQNGDQTMVKLNGAMTAINESSGEISKIIKVIEEIAFQTNLLALNAAVEAARAGEHGKGFAVVADEVRNLAQRAAQASREITGLIEDSVNKAKEGTQVAGEVGKSLAAIVGDVTKVTDLIDGITKASEEQAQGVDQVNTAVSQMDKVTQQNAAGAEESASAAEELSAQAATVKSMVDELSVMVGGQSGTQAGSSASSSGGGYKEKRTKAYAAPKLSKHPVGAVAASPSANEFSALDGDDDGLTDF